MIGNLPDNVLQALLEKMPIEFSVLDSNDNVLAWNKHETRIFKRPESVVGRNVRDCHPKKSLQKVESIISEMKAGEREKAKFWIDLDIENAGSPQKILIEYHALRDPDGNYIGCLEASQNVTPHRKLEGEQRLLK
ncbi:PAS domain-containing protein [Candidatus Bathyarchaeota archaeon]|nr:PAS domain-containing protein [Candidatus Bathyarchaeota archaeon]